MLLGIGITLCITTIMNQVKALDRWT